MTSVFVLALVSGASAETLESALARAYGNNPNLNAQRANVRATDENVSRAKSGYRPQVNASADAGRTYGDFQRPGGASNIERLYPRGVGLEIDQNLFNGFRTQNSVEQAESSVLGSRQTLTNTEQNTLFHSAAAYMNVLRDTAILDLQRNNVEVIDEQLRQTNDRFNVGEVTRTDVAQAQSRLAASGAGQPRRGQPAHQRGAISPGDRRRAPSACAGTSAGQARAP